MNIIQLLTLLHIMLLCVAAFSFTLKILQYRRYEKRTPEKFQDGDTYLEERKYINSITNILYVGYIFTIIATKIYPITFIPFISIVVLMMYQSYVTRAYDRVIIIMRKMLEEIDRISNAKIVEEINNKYDKGGDDD